MKTRLGKLFIASAFMGSMVFCQTSVMAASDRISELKEKILEIALENNKNRDNLKEIRASLDPLVQELGEYHNPVTAEDDLAALSGVWQELWSDDIEPEPPLFSVDRSKTYQIVTDQGYFYNVSQLNGALGVKFSAYLRGKYDIADDYLAIEFTNVGAQLGGLSDSGQLEQKIQDIETGEEGLIDMTGQSQFPNGPIGAKGFIRNIYIDADFRVATGYNAADNIQDLFVLVREPQG